jgi:hypothetical protein
VNFKNEEAIKQMIVDGHKRGVCDSEGDSLCINGRAIAKPRPLGSAAKTYVVRNARVVFKE